MVMSDSDIRFKYERADNKKAVVQILADLNGCNKAQMMLKLQELGLMPKVPDVSGVDDRKALDLYETGMSDKDIAKELNVAAVRVTNWRRALGLSPNKEAKRAPAGRVMTLAGIAPLLAALAERYPEAELVVAGKPLMSFHLQADMDAMGFVRKAYVALETEEVSE